MIYLGADHRGFYLKEAIKDYLTTRGIKWEDLGNQEYQEDDDYPLFARKVAQKVTRNPPEEKGILICGSGIGMSIAANRWKKVRAGLCLSGYMAEKGRKEDDINIQGYPFYTGSFKAKKEIEIDRIKDRYFLKFDDFKSIVAEVKVNSKSAGCIYLPPFEIEITELLKKGKNTIEIDFYTSLRNLLGPHHLKNPNPEFVGPNSFVKSKGDLWYETGWRRLYSTLPAGIGRIKIVEEK